MKFICNQSKLSKALNIVSKAVSTRTTIPILKGILIDVKNGKLTLSSSDLDISIMDTITVDSIEEGKTVVNAKLFSDIIRKLPNKEIEFYLNNDKLEVECDNSQFKIATFSYNDFPDMNRVINEEAMLFDKIQFKEIIRKTSFSASSDESKGIITGVLIEIEENTLKMIAIDGYRMAITKEEISENYNKRVIVSAKILNDVSRIISEAEDEVDFIKFSISNNAASIVLGKIEINLRLMEGEFIKYKDIIPAESGIKVKLNKKDFYNSIERASLLSKEGKNNLIKLDFNGNNMNIFSQSEEGSVKEEIFIEKDGEDIEIGFNAKYLLDILKVIDDEEVTMNFNTPITPCLVRPVDGSNFEYLILPVRITKNL